MLPASRRLSAGCARTLTTTVPPPDAAGEAAGRNRRVARIRAELEIDESSPLGALEVLKPPVLRRVPELKHSLDRVLFSPGIHLMRSHETKLANFDGMIEQIAQPNDFRFDLCSPFTKPSEDMKLTSYARERKIKFVGSTSSMTSVLGLLHFLVIQSKKLNLDGFNSKLQAESKRHVARAFLPVRAKLSNIDGVYALDSQKAECDDLDADMEEIDRESGPMRLASMGIILERLLTMDHSQFSTFLDKNPMLKVEEPSEFNYSQSGNILVRSQIDAYDSRLPKKTFDLKTRTTNRIRMDVHNYKDHLDYHLTKVYGSHNSFERERFDMYRGALLKFYHQVTLGNMSGIFVCYHNTQKIYGFEYISADDMEKVLFPEPSRARVVLSQMLSIADKLLQEITATKRDTYELVIGINPSLTKVTINARGTGNWRDQEYAIIEVGPKDYLGGDENCKKDDGCGAFQVTAVRNNEEGEHFALKEMFDVAATRFEKQWAKIAGRGKDAGGGDAEESMPRLIDVDTEKAEEKVVGLRESRDIQVDTSSAEQTGVGIMREETTSSSTALFHAKEGRGDDDADESSIVNRLQPVFERSEEQPGRVSQAKTSTSGRPVPHRPKKMSLADRIGIEIKNAEQQSNASHQAKGRRWSPPLYKPIHPDIKNAKAATDSLADIPLDAETLRASEKSSLSSSSSAAAVEPWEIPLVGGSITAAANSPADDKKSSASGGPFTAEMQLLKRGIEIDDAIARAEDQWARLVLAKDLATARRRRQKGSRKRQLQEKKETLKRNGPLAVENPGKDHVNTDVGIARDEAIRARNEEDSAEVRAIRRAEYEWAMLLRAKQIAHGIEDRDSLKKYRAKPVPDEQGRAATASTPEPPSPAEIWHAARRIKKKRKQQLLEKIKAELRRQKPTTKAAREEELNTVDGISLQDRDYIPTHSAQKHGWVYSSFLERPSHRARRTGRPWFRY